MAIQKRPDRRKPWRARYSMPGGGERSKAFRRKIDAERWLAAQETDRQRGEWTDPRLAKTTFGEWAPTYMAARVHLAPTTRATAESLMRNHVLPHFERRPLGSVSRTDVQGFVAELQSKGLAASTTRQCYLLARGVFASAVESDLIARTPCRAIHLPQADQTEMRFLDQDEVAALIEATGPDYSAIVATAAYTGARFGELAGLQISRLDLLRGTLTVAQQLSEVNGELSIRAPKTAASRRQIALPRRLVERLSEHLMERPPVDGFVFTSPRGALLRRNNFRKRVFLPAVRASVGEPMRFHDLRHSHVAALIAQGEHPKLIQTRLGHSSIKVTLDRYGHLFEGLDEAAAERLDASLPDSPPAQIRPKTENNVVELRPKTSETP